MQYTQCTRSTWLGGRVGLAVSFIWKARPRQLDALHRRSALLAAQSLQQTKTRQKTWTATNKNNELKILDNYITSWWKIRQIDGYVNLVCSVRGKTSLALEHTAVANDNFRELFKFFLICCQKSECHHLEKSVCFGAWPPNQWQKNCTKVWST